MMKQDVCVCVCVWVCVWVCMGVCACKKHRKDMFETKSSSLNYNTFKFCIALILLVLNFSISVLRN